MSTDITHNVIPDGADAGRGRSVQDILTTDTRTVPSTLLHTSTVDMGSADIPTRRYTSADYHQREISHVWRRVWQMACREEDIPEPGDHLVYDIGDDSVIVVRGEDDQIRAFPNSCLHRGTALCEGPGNSAKFTCRFHGMQWDIDGTLNSMPSSWDFPHVNPAEFNLPAVRTGTWGGFVFVCFDPNTESLESYLEVLPEQFTAFPLENRHKAVHVGKVIDCNWKVAVEAFLEAYHIAATHPQTLPYFGDELTQYDVWPGVRHISRVVSNAGIPSPQLRTPVSPDEIVAAFNRDVPPSRTNKPLPADENPRAFLAEAIRQNLGRSTGVDLDAVSDSELLDSIQYFAFPNFSPWAGIGAPLIYRWRPYEHNPNRCIFEVMLLFVAAPTTKRRRGAPIHWLSDDETFSDAHELGDLGALLDQDLANLRWVQQGLRASRKPGVTLARYQESRIRHFHQTLSTYVPD
jgi:phenylpropionate dioxygenase-like ring-hydroxylating dioxygenase large terminal subunit